MYCKNRMKYTNITRDRMLNFLLMQEIAQSAMMEL